MTVDPITFEVIKHRLWQINDEQGIAIKTISASPIVVEGNDYNVGLFTKHAALVTAGVGSLVHVTTMSDALTAIIAQSENIFDGDILMTNDPFMGALHQNDVVVVSPLFRFGELFMWVGNVLHHPDVGGIDAGSFCINAKTLDEDPPRFFMKLVERGKLISSNEQKFVNNSRLPDAVALDLRAQIGAINVAKKRLHELIDERGEATIGHVMEQSIKVAEEQVRKCIGNLPEGAWAGKAYMDGVRVNDERICQVVLRLTCDRKTLCFDYSGTSEQVDAAVNSTYPATVAGSAVPLYSFLCQGQIDWNDGLKNCIKVIAPEGTVVNATYPAPVSISTVGFRWLVTVAATQAIAHMFNSSEIYRDRTCPSWNSSSNCNNIFAQFPDGQRTGGLLSDHRGSGAAGRSFGDGFSHAGTITSYASSLGNIETTESKFPIRYLFRKRMLDSAGAGRYRGGATSEVAITPHGIDKIALKLTNTAGTEQTNAHGIQGGYPGAGSQSVLIRAVDQTLLRGERNNFSNSNWDPEKASWLPSKADEIVYHGDVYGFWAAGGGGFGDPITRPIESLVEDISTGIISKYEAERMYCCVFAADGNIDINLTKELRAQKRSERKRNAATNPNTSKQFCIICKTSTSQGYIRQPLSKAGPLIALRYNGDGPHFELKETVCLDCGSLVDVREVLKEQHIHRKS